MFLHSTNLRLISGTQNEIEAALDMIREKFPEKRFPHFTLQEISPELYQKLFPLVPEFLQVSCARRLVIPPKYF